MIYPKLKPFSPVRSLEFFHTNVIFILEDAIAFLFYIASIIIENKNG